MCIRDSGRQASKIFNNRKYDEVSLQKQYDDAFDSDKPVELSFRNCSGVNAIYNAGWRYKQQEVDEAIEKKVWGRFGSISDNFINILKAGVEKSKLFNPSCESNQWIEGVNPWFDPEGQFKYKINKNLEKTCGKRLERCHYSRSNYRDQSSYEMTMEPAYLILSLIHI